MSVRRRPAASGESGRGSPVRALAAALRRSGTRMAVVLWLGVLVSALAAVQASHRTRVLFGDLERLRLERDALLEERGRLLLERSTFAAYARVEGVAVERLDMRMPELADIELVPVTGARPEPVLRRGHDDERP